MLTLNLVNASAAKRGGYFLVIASLMVFFGIMACHHKETSAWKSYQEEFRTLRKQRLQLALERVRASLNPKDTLQLNKEIEEAQAQLNSSDYQKLTDDVSYVDGQIKLAEESDHYLIPVHSSENATAGKKNAWLFSPEEDRVTHKKRMIDSLQAIRGTLSARIAPLEARYKAALQKKDSLYRYIYTAANELAKNEGHELQEYKIKPVIVGKEEKCVSCHLGVTDTLFKADTLIARDSSTIAQWIANNRFTTPQYSISRTGAKHDTVIAEVRKVYRIHPNVEVLLGNHKITNRSAGIGCTSCHGGNPNETSSPELAHGVNTDRQIITGVFVESNCVSCHQSEMTLEGAPTLTLGKQLYADFGCNACHESPGFAQTTKAGPSLVNISRKVNSDWLMGWLRNPKDWAKNARMPHINLSEDQIRAVTAYLIEQSKASDYLAFYYYGGGGDPEKGASLFAESGCASCHATNNSLMQRVRVGNTFGPPLGHISEKVSGSWLLDWLKQPKNYAQSTRMPSLRLSDKEAVDIVAYLLASDSGRTRYSQSFARPKDLIEQGRLIIEDAGCAACHDINGIASPNRSIDLTEFGKKSVDRLVFGAAPIKHDWTSWTVAKLKNSWMNASASTPQKMPNYDMTDQEATAIAVLLKGWTGKQSDLALKHVSSGSAIAKGTWIDHWYNCSGCHTWQREAQASVIDTALYFHLDGEGAKVTNPWLTSYLKGPTVIRPGVKLRMPNYGFDDNTVNSIVAYIDAISLKPAASSDTASSNMEIGAEITKSCISCHSLGNARGNLLTHAPNLSNVSTRLNRDWVKEWLLKPDVYQLRTDIKEHRAFAATSASVFPQLNGNKEQQVDAVLDYLYSVGNTDLPKPSAYSYIFNRNIYVDSAGTYTAPRYILTMRYKARRSTSTVR